MSLQVDDLVSNGCSDQIHHMLRKLTKPARIKKITAGCGTLFPTRSTPSSSFCRNVFGAAAVSTMERRLLCSLIGQLRSMATAPRGPHHRGPLCRGRTGMVVGEDLGDDGGNAPAGRNVEEFVRPVRIRMRAEDASHDKLRLRKFFAEQSP
jgi:hypothetical protein